MRPASNPVVGDPAFHLRALEQTDASAWFEYAARPEVKLHTSSNVTAIDDLHAMIERSHSSDPNSPVLFAICSTADQRFLGAIGFHTISALNRTAEITYEIRPECWGRGLASACCAAVVDWGFSRAGYVRIQGTVLDSNVASARVLSKCGFELEGKLRSYRMVRGVPRDYWLYARVVAPITPLG
jgi:RimJ/RimL family protein N-acetyltransferase